MTAGRRIEPLATMTHHAYDMEGPVQPEMSYAAQSYDKATGEGVYVMHMQPGAVTIPHTHKGREDFLILEGSVIESDGTRLKAGDFVSYAPGTHHHTRSETGCVLIGFDWKPR